MCMVLIYIFVSEQFILLIILITDIDNQIEQAIAEQGHPRGLTLK